MNKREWMLQFMLRHGPKWKGSVDVASQLYDAIVAATPEPTDEGWIEHRGEKPYPEGRVTVRLRGGRVLEDDSDVLIWAYDGLEPDMEIVAWRPA